MVGRLGGDSSSKTWTQAAILVGPLDCQAVLFRAVLAGSHSQVEADDLLTDFLDDQSGRVRFEIKRLTIKTFCLIV